MTRHKRSREVVLILACVIMVEVLFVISALKGSSKPYRQTLLQEINNGLPPTAARISELGISDCVRILETATNIEWKRKVLRELPKFESGGAAAIPCLLDIIENKNPDLMDTRLIPDAMDSLAMLRGEEVMKELIRQLRRADDIHVAERLIPYTNNASPALPVLLVQLNRHSSAGRALANVNPNTREFAERLIELAVSKNVQERERLKFLEELGDLGSGAAGVVERVSSLLNPALTQGSAIAATQVTTAEMGQRQVITALGRIGPAAHVAVPKLMPFLTNTSVGLRLYSARALWEITRDPKLVVPVLKEIIEEEALNIPTFFYDFDMGVTNSVPLRGRVTHLSRPVERRQLGLEWTAAYLLGEIGKPAESALPAMRRMIRNIGDFPCIEALFTLRAVAQITGDSSSFLSLLLKHLNSDSQEAAYVRVPVIHFLVEFGPVAQPALDRLQVLSTSEEPSVAFAATCATE